MSAAFNQNVVLVGLNSYSVALPNAAPYTFDWKMSIPTIVDGGGQSAAVMTITDTTASTTLYTSVAGATGGSVVVGVAAGDVIQFAVTGNGGVDAALNAIKTVISISQGVN